MPEGAVDEQYIKSSKAQMDHFMKLSIYAEKVKSHEKNQRQIGSNKQQQNETKSQGKQN
jgi:hypothetical protein